MPVSSCPSGGRRKTQGSRSIFSRDGLALVILHRALWSPSLCISGSTRQKAFFGSAEVFNRSALLWFFGSAVTAIVGEMLIEGIEKMFGFGMTCRKMRSSSHLVIPNSSLRPWFSQAFLFSSHGYSGSRLRHRRKSMAPGSKHGRTMPVEIVSGAGKSPKGQAEVLCGSLALPQLLVIAISCCLTRQEIWIRKCARMFRPDPAVSSASDSSVGLILRGGMPKDILRSFKRCSL